MVTTEPGITQLEAMTLNFGGKSICTFERGVISCRRRDRETEEKLDEQFDRIGPNAWRMKTLFDAKKTFTGKWDNAYVIGKGRSADYLSTEDFKPNSLVLACNEAVLLAEKYTDTVYGIRQDYARGIPIRPNKAYMLVPQVLVPLYYNFKHTILINPGTYMRESASTFILAIMIAKFHCAKTITMYGFDGIMRNDFTYGSVANINNIQAGDNSHLHRQKQELLLVKGVNLIWSDPASFQMEH